MHNHNANFCRAFKFMGNSIRAPQVLLTVFYSEILSPCEEQCTTAKNSPGLAMGGAGLTKEKNKFLHRIIPSKNVLLEVACPHYDFSRTIAWLFFFSNSSSLTILICEIFLHICLLVVWMYVVSRLELQPEGDLGFFFWYGVRNKTDLFAGSWWWWIQWVWWAISRWVRQR